jgi:flagellin-like hook-associated protein FlgL
MLGSLTSVSTALRTASEARTRVDRAAREIATGQRVSSVKDDGAAWARAADLRSQRSDWQGTAAQAQFVHTDSAAKLGIKDFEANELLPDLIAALAGAVGAADTPNFSRAVVASNQVHATTEAVWRAHHYGSDPATAAARAALTVRMPDGAVTSYDTYTHSPFQYSNVAQVEIAPNVHLFTNNGGTIEVDRTTEWVLRLPDAAAARNALGYFRHLRENSTGYQAALGRHAASQRTMEHLIERSGEAVDRIDRSISSLTDADLGKASTTRAQAETRQRLALETIRTALNANGQFAGGLLGNVQRSQRGVLA